MKGLNLTRNLKHFQAAIEAPEQVELKKGENKVIELNQKRIDLLNKIEALKQRKQ